MFNAILIQVAVPIILIVVVAITRQPNRARWGVTVVAFGMVIANMLIGSRWDLTSLYLRVAFPILFLVACVLGYRKIRTPESPPGKIPTIVSWAASLGLIVFVSGFLWFSIRGYRTPDGAVDLASPLRGTHVVLNGGASPFTNAHFRARAQSFALDILGVNGLGARAAWFGSREELENYVIYGEPVFSPCDGTVRAVVDGLPDQIPPQTDRDNPAGNHVLIECDGFEVLLAHLRQQSVRVETGQPVAVGDPLGEVGNSGNTSEPHLHIHAERDGAPGVILDGRSVPITIDGRFLVRNSVLRSRPRVSGDPRPTP